MKKITRNLFAYSVVFLFLGLTLISLNTINAQQTNTTTPQQSSQYGNAVYKLLIIAPCVFADELQPLVKHKNNLGISTKLATIDEVNEQMYWHGRDQAEKIKYYIKTAYDEWGIQYVLLVGGKKGQTPFWYLPPRYVHMDDHWESEYLSDLYFADIYDSNGNFSSWDSDGDGLYGEWYYGATPDDQPIDLIPDVAVGRLPCRSEWAVSICVDKIITYETSTAGKPWFSSMLVVAGDTYPVSQNANWTGNEGEYYGDRAIENMTGFTPTRMYTSDGTFSKQSQVIRTFNKGFGFTYFVGHGNPKTWGNHPPDNEEFVQGLTIQHMFRLRNNNKLPVCIVSGCHNCQFDVTVWRLFNKTGWYRQENALECWGERITRTLNGGSIATIGCAALGYTKEDKLSFKGGINELEGVFFTQYGQNQVTILGDAWAQAITGYLTTYPIDWNTTAVSDSWVDVKVVNSWVLIGDPSLQIGGYPQ